jgi:hypothetical protein
MLTPKEKAEQLVDRYFKLLNYEFGDLVYSLRDKQPKQCALIAVDEIIEFGNQQGIREPMMYWQSVKQEINKL